MHHTYIMHLSIQELQDLDVHIKTHTHTHTHTHFGSTDTHRPSLFLWSRHTLCMSQSENFEISLYTCCCEHCVPKCPNLCSSAAKISKSESETRDLTNSGWLDALRISKNTLFIVRFATAVVRAAAVFPPFGRDDPPFCAEDDDLDFASSFHCWHMPVCICAYVCVYVRMCVCVYICVCIIRIWP